MSNIILAQETAAVNPLAGVFLLFIYAGAALLVIAPLWNIYVKADKPGWMAIVPILNIIILLDIAGRPGWWLILLLIPGVNVIIGIILNIDLARAFGKGVGFGIGLTLLAPIFLLILGFDNSQYVGTPT